MEINGISVIWLRHASFKIVTPDKKVIYIDPWEADSADKADYIIVTHPHFDHASETDIRRLSKKSTVIIAPKEYSIRFNNSKEISPGEVISLDKKMTISAIPAYNTHHFRSPGSPFHRKEDNWVGIIINIDGTTIYHAGDTDRIAEMKDLNVDLALLPVGGTYTMDAEEAAKAAEDINCRIAVPMHWGKIVGSKDDAETFRDKTGCEVKILD